MNPKNRDLNETSGKGKKAQEGPAEKQRRSRFSKLMEEKAVSMHLTAEKRIMGEKTAKPGSSGGFVSEKYERVLNADDGNELVEAMSDLCTAVYGRIEDVPLPPMSEEESKEQFSKIVERIRSGEGKPETGAKKNSKE